MKAIACRIAAPIAIVTMVSLWTGTPLVAQTTASQLVNLRHWSGQAVAPVYEGFDINADGSYNMWFGYMNRNYEEELDIPVGPDNTFEPGGDRGQPTHFTRAATRTCSRSRYRKTSASRRSMWKLTARGHTATGRRHAEAGLADRSAADDARRQQREDQLEPAAGGEGPCHRINRCRTPRRSRVSATDDGLPKRRGETVGMTVDVGEVSRPRLRAVRAVAGQARRTARQRPPRASASRATTSCRPSSTTGRASRPATSATTAAGPTRKSRSRVIGLPCAPRSPNPQSAVRSPQAAIRNPQRQRSRSDVAPIFQTKLPDVPSPWHVRADVAHHLRGRAAVGAFDPAARRQPRHAAVASRQDRRHPPLQERPLAERRRDRDDCPLGR